MSTEMNSTPTTRSNTTFRDPGLTFNRAELLAGIQAGVGAGYVMGIVAMVVSWIHNWGFWLPFNDVAGSLVPGLVGIGTFGFNPAAVLIGLIAHFSTSILLGLGFVALYSGILKLSFAYGIPVSVGLVYGLITWLVARFLILPILGSAIYAAPAFLVAHLVFGATLGLLYPRMPARGHRQVE